jgi:hypothetical protein
MASRPQDTDSYLERHLQDGWADAQGNAEVLADEIVDLPWPERLQQLDWFFWKLGARFLDEAQAEAVIDRRMEAMLGEPATASFVATAEHTLAAVLMALEHDPRHVDGAHQALLYAVSPLAVHRGAAESWLARHGVDHLRAVLEDSPGTAFVLLARSFTDDALTFAARDSFWRTMLGRDVGF